LRPGHYACINVRDTGCGMDENVQAHLFEPFFTTKEVGKGTGLGLATVYGIIKQSNGHIDVESAPGQGTTFRVYLPRVQSVADAVVELPKPSVPVPDGHETILLVEDEDGVRSLARTVLQESGYTVLEASGGEQAVDLCKQHADKIHLLVSDVVMPRLSGSALLKQLVPLHPEMRVMFMSGYSDSALVTRGITSGEVECLLKPFTPDALRRKVRELLDRPRFVERRQFARPRPKPSVRAECRFEGANLAVEILNLSEGGVGLVLSKPLDKGQLVEVALECGGETIRKTGMVVWSMPCQSGVYQTGLRFLALLDDEQLRGLTEAGSVAGTAAPAPSSASPGLSAPPRVQ